jgi:hypothetical protein
MQSEAHINYSRLWQYAFIRDATDKTSQPEWRLTQVVVPVKPELDRLKGVARRSIQNRAYLRPYAISESLVMSLHARLGQNSPIRQLDDYLLQFIVSFGV